MERNEKYGVGVETPSIKKENYFQIMKKTVELIKNNDLVEMLPRIFRGDKLEELLPVAENLYSGFTCSHRIWIQFIEKLSDQDSKKIVNYLLTKEKI